MGCVRADGAMIVADIFVTVPFIVPRSLRLSGERRYHAVQEVPPRPTRSINPWVRVHVAADRSRPAGRHTGPAVRGGDRPR